MSLYTKLTANVLFPLHERMKKHSTIDVFRAMEKTQWLSADEMSQLQLDRLREFLSRIGEQVPYYRQLFSTLNFDPVALKSLQDLQKLPLDRETCLGQSTNLHAS